MSNLSKCIFRLPNDLQHFPKFLHSTRLSYLYNATKSEDSFFCCLVKSLILSLNLGDFPNCPACPFLSSKSPLISILRVFYFIFLIFFFKGLWILRFAEASSGRFLLYGVLGEYSGICFNFSS